MTARGSAFVLGTALVLLTSGCARFVEGLRSHAPPAGSESAVRLAPGPFGIERRDFEFVDESRATMANDDFEGAPTRHLDVSTWAPDRSSGPVPLIVYSHGFTGNRTEMLFLLEHLASHGYGVAALDFPLTNGDAPGGANFLDLSSQPGDVRFVLDSVLALSNEARGFAVDEERIGLAGLSYGGLTTTLLTYHPTEREPRAKAAVSIAGPSQMFNERFFERNAPPFLMVAGTGDAIVPYPLNAAPLSAKAPRAALVSLEAGTHLGFVEFARRWLRFSHHPDGLACESITEQIDEGDPADQESPFEPLGTPETGIDPNAWDPPCSGPEELPEAMRPQRQQALTSLAVRAFFESQFAADPTVREAAGTYLTTRLPRELDDVRYTHEEHSR